MSQPLHIVTVVGARPNFVKAAAFVPAMIAAATRADQPLRHTLLHTGQHYDFEMSQVFFDEFELPAPDIHLEIGSGTQGSQTAGMLSGIEASLLADPADAVIAIGDTNSTLAAALAAAKLGTYLAHIEAGLRSYRWDMPEEVNRRVTDHVSNLLFAPTDVAVRNLEGENVRGRIVRTGDVMHDVFCRYRDEAIDRAAWAKLNLEPTGYLVATLHRAENTDNDAILARLLDALIEIARTCGPLVLPMHPRTRGAIRRIGRDLSNVEGLVITPPFSYVDMVSIVSRARGVITDSGGLQKEAAFAGVPCITMRDETEWLETVECGWNTLVGSDAERLVATARALRLPDTPGPDYGDGATGAAIARAILEAL